VVGKVVIETTWRAWEREPIMGSGGLCPSGVQGQSEAPEAERIFIING